MTKKISNAARSASVALLMAAWIPTACLAASDQTDAFVANVRLNALFLSQSSVLAADRSENTALREFARAEANADDAIIAAVDARSPQVVAQTLPVTVAAIDSDTSGAGAVLTGRSAAVEKPAYTSPAGTGALMPAAALTIAHIAASKGKAFDSLYKSAQLSALRQLAGFYEAYGATGDDAALRQMARNELAATNDRIAELSRF